MHRYGKSAVASVGRIQELSVDEVEMVGGGKDAACVAMTTIVGGIIGGILGGGVGAVVGAAVGTWYGEKVCPPAKS